MVDTAGRSGGNVTVSTERLKRAKKELADAVAAFQTGDDGNVSQEGRRLVEELGTLDDAEWDPLLASVEDDELRDLLGSVRQRTSEVKRLHSVGALPQIRQILYRQSFDFSQRSLMIPLRFNNAGGHSLLDSNQDLEDTLWIGTAIFQVVSDAMQAMDDALNLEAQRRCIGTAFDENLRKAEDAVGEIRRMLTAVQGEHAPDESD